ncbi:MAG: helix-turn-helix domain-containing protein [Polyangiaceae bacterium]
MDPAPTLDPDVMGILEAYAWPGNIRELRNVLERAVAVADSPRITMDDLPERLRALHVRARADSDVLAPAAAIDLAAVPSDYRGAMEAIEAEYSVWHCSTMPWNQTHTARRLGMPLRTLVHRMKVLAVRRPDPAP